MNNRISFPRRQSLRPPNRNSYNNGKSYSNNENLRYRSWNSSYGYRCHDSYAYDRSYYKNSFNTHDRFHSRSAYNDYEYIRRSYGNNRSHASTRYVNPKVSFKSIWVPKDLSIDEKKSFISSYYMNTNSKGICIPCANH